MSQGNFTTYICTATIMTENCQTAAYTRTNTRQPLQRKFTWFALVNRDIHKLSIRKLNKTNARLDFSFK